MSKPLLLSLVVPVYKEEPRLPGSIRQIKKFMEDEARNNLEVEVIFVDDGSPDNSVRIIDEWIKTSANPGIKVISYSPNQGKGHAVKTGVLAARGDLILMSDTDLSTPLHDWRKLFDAIQSGADVACGSRAVPGAHIGAPPPLHRRILSRLFNFLVRMSGVHGIKDTQCGFKLFTAPHARELFRNIRIKRFAFDVELISMACDFGYRVAEVPVDWYYSGHSTVKVFSSGTRMLLDVLRLAVRRMVLGKRKPKRG